MNGTPLLDQIRVFSEALVGDLPEAGGDHFEPSPRPSVRRGLVVAFVMAMVVMVAGVLPLLLISGGDDPAEDPVATSSTQRSNSTTQATETTLATQTTAATQATEATLSTEETLSVAGFDGQLVPLTVIETGVAESVVGDFGLTIVQTDVSFAPGGLVTTPFGFASVSMDGSQLLISEDAIEWFAAPSPFTGPLPLSMYKDTAVTGDEENGYTVFTEQADGDLLRWHSADYIEWELVEPPIEKPADREPSEIKYQVDQLPPVACLREQDENACGIWYSLDSGWVWGLGPETQGGVAMPIFASADGVNWEGVETDVPGWGAIADGMSARYIEAAGWSDANGIGWFVGSAGNVAILSVYLWSDDPHDNPAPAFHWVTKLP